MNLPRPVLRAAAALVLWLTPLALFAAGAPLHLDRAHSHLEIAVKATVGSFTAHLKQFEAGVTLDPATGRIATAAFRCAFAGIDTGNNQRNRDMNAWQDTARYPDVTFALASLTPAGEHAFTADGELDLHGVRRLIRFPVEITISGDTVTIDGTAALDTRLFGLPVITKFWVLKVNPVVRVRFHLEGRFQPPPSALDHPHPPRG